MRVLHQRKDRGQPGDHVKKDCRSGTIFFSHPDLTSFPLLARPVQQTLHIHLDPKVGVVLGVEPKHSALVIILGLDMRVLTELARRSLVLGSVVVHLVRFYDYLKVVRVG